MCQRQLRGKRKGRCPDRGCQAGCNEPRARSAKRRMCKNQRRKQCVDNSAGAIQDDDRWNINSHDHRTVRILSYEMHQQKSIRFIKNFD